ncbi:glutathione S-transferase sigma 2 [Brachionus plicatilis]|uniref:glutathione transferase n=1 Tax=Brachionus plicatilis TaxID=10195 RepID=A0A3M7STX7_BRAPC|nr:glutathione S-transferase sigma 2 [Brachionus plicatilis]
MGCGSSKTQVIEPGKDNTSERGTSEKHTSDNSSENESNDQADQKSESVFSNSRKNSTLASSKTSVKPRSYKLNYFDFSGRGELIRLIFAVSNTDYNDERTGFKDWQTKRKKTPLEQLPNLEVDKEPTLVQSMAIARYLAREMNLAGSDNYEITKVDFVLDLCKEFMDLLAAYVFPELLFPTDEKEEIIDKFLKHVAEDFLKNIEILITKFGKNGYAVGNKLTVADLFIHDLVSNMIKLDSFVLDNYSKLKQNRNKVEEDSNLKSYLDNRRKMQKLNF